MGSLPKQTLNPNKHLKEQFVSNLDGSSILEIAALLTIVPLLVLLRYSIGLHYKIDNSGKSKKNDDEIVFSRNWKDYTYSISLDFIFIVFPMLLFFTVLSEWVYHGAVFLSFSLLLILSVTTERSSSGLQKRREQSFSFRTSVSSYRVALMLITCLCILAVDFTIFPRRYAKTETYGTSLMDLGVGSFVLANAIVSRQARNVVSYKNWLTGVKSTLPLLLLGFIRLITTSSVDYQVHVTEYGVHWNFFFTLAAISILTSFINIPAKYCGILGFALLASYQTWLVSGLNEYLLSDERGSNLISKNKEGVFSILGYWGMYLLGVNFGYRLFYSTSGSIGRVFLVSLLLWIVTLVLDSYVERVSRRTCNMPYVTWVLAQNLQALGIFMFSSYIPMNDNKLSSLEEAIDQNLLATFLLGNVFTGMVNLAVDTIFASPFSSFVILTGYAFALSGIIGTIHFSGFRLKFWCTLLQLCNCTFVQSCHLCFQLLRLLPSLTSSSCIFPKFSPISPLMDASNLNSTNKPTFSSFAQSSRSGGRGRGNERDNDRRRPQGRGGGGGGGGGKDRIDALGRLLTRILRHMATELRLNMRSDGFVEVKELLNLNLKTSASIQLKSHTIDEIKEAVRRDNKQRFSLVEENGKFLIRANQGHSITTVETEKLLKPILSPEEAPVCVHGTYRKNLESILVSGLKRMNRNHVHFSCGLPTDGEVISGMRRDVNVLIFLDIKKALEDGIAFYISDNRVILTEGIDGVVPVDYFLKIESWPNRQ